MCHHRPVGSFVQRGGVYGIFGADPVGCHRTHDGRTDVARFGPCRRAWHLTSDTGSRRHRIISRRAAAYGSRTGGTPYNAEGTLRPHGTGWFLPRPRCNSGSYLGYRSLRGRKLGPRRDLITCHRGHARRVRSLWGGYAAGGSAATLVWIGPHRFHARFVARANVLWDCAVRAVPGGAGLRAVVAEGSPYGAALTPRRRILPL